MQMLRSARSLADELGLTGRTVLFNETWIPYEQRGAWLLDADVGVSTHFDHAETRFSFRTRILDYFWAGLPVVCTAGDSLADLIARHNLGITVPAEDVDATERAIETLVADAAGRAARSTRVREVAAGLTWTNAALPLVNFCASPRRAADHAGLTRGGAMPVPLRTDTERRTRLSEATRPSAARRVAKVLRAEGPAGVVRRVRKRLR
jgi:hypothetical protein